MTIKLARVAADNWASLDGLAVSLGLPDLRKLRVDRFCNFIWWWLTRNAAEQQEIDKMRATLWRPPAGVAPDPRSPWAPQAETSSFDALKAGVGGGPPVEGAPPRPPRPRQAGGPQQPAHGPLGPGGRHLPAPTLPKRS